MLAGQAGLLAAPGLTPCRHGKLVSAGLRGSQSFERAWPARPELIKRLMEAQEGLGGHCAAIGARALSSIAAGEPGLGRGRLSHGFADRELQDFAIGVLGDLHLEPAQMALFRQAVKQVRTALNDDHGSRGARVVQLGDLGGYQHQPGSSHCFRVAEEYLRSFQMPAALVLGNHDLEGDEFATDELNLAAWHQAFEQRHYWEAELGPALCLGLSTVRFRSNLHSAHEVFVDEEQLDWLEGRLQASEGRPVLMFTHAPPLGCGLKVVEGVHVKNRCAWLNHSSNPGIFMDLVRRYSNIRLWFSGHYHLSQDYADSVSTVGGCTFVQTGVIGECDRDGLHQSRIVRGNRQEFRVSSLNHVTGEERLDLRQRWDESAAPRLAWQADSQPSCWPHFLHFHQPATRPSSQLNGKADDGSQWFGAGPDTVLRRMDRLLIEYQASHAAAVGAVFHDIEPSWGVRLVDASGREVESRASSSEAPAEDGSAAVAVELLDPQQSVRRRLERNEHGSFFQVFQHNKWRIRYGQMQQQPAAVGTAV